ncbi:hypothetical protein CEP54_002799 [Fusarium duplospermum]|uniref:PAN-3 domain-containing protein n=1 Tax=Fusarium duplospermum TaxID=1325734 RepID=A0A428QT65_9HYPO|nr:hypothetical protein CEP54_002799 [Fusarium duplospermum]
MTTSIEPLCESDPDFRKRPNPTLKLNAIIDPTCVSAQGFWRSAALRLQLFQDLSPDECIQKCSQDSECVMVQSEPGRYCNTFKGRLANILPINLQSAGPRFYEKECFECACL